MQGISTGAIFFIIGIYFLFLILISYFTSGNSKNEDFFIGGRKSPWFVVAFGMIGATLSGVTFISVPGWVTDSQFSYLQTVFGYLLGYIVIAFVLMPMYYRLRLTSIYTYLEQRFGTRSYKTGAAYFLLSRTIGASFRLYLVVIVLQTFVMNQFGIPFAGTILITIGLIWIYTYRGGIRTIIWTDTLQTASMLIAVCTTIYFVGDAMGWSFSEIFEQVGGSEYSKVWFFEGGWSDPRNFFKQFFGGMFITIVMTGLDQDMMQKNLSCRNIGDAQKNMLSFSVILIFANILFLSLGALLYLYASQNGIEVPTRMVSGVEKEATDLMYPTLALQHLHPVVGVSFLIGLIAAAYSSADSALTALTTSFCIDFLGFDKSDASEESKKKKRLLVHIGISILLFWVIMLFYYINDDAVINSLFTMAGYTYGPLLGLYAFGFFINKGVNDQLIPAICIASPLITFLLDTFSEELLWGYKFSFELLIVNGLLTFLGMLLISKKTDHSFKHLLSRWHI
ncbi:MAG: sodium:solute symporter [Saprospiraceae bacterium]|nr:sodium:solute symporter [Saprospiraceae bacterium]